MCPGYENLGLYFNKNCSSAQLLKTVKRANSILASSYEIMLCSSYLLEIMDEFQVPQQVKEPLVYTKELSTTKRFQTATIKKKNYLSNKNMSAVEPSCIAAFHS